MSDQSDQNTPPPPKYDEHIENAHRLAKLAEDMVRQAEEHVAALRGTAAGIGAKQPYTDPHEVASKLNKMLEEMDESSGKVKTAKEDTTAVKQDTTQNSKKEDGANQENKSATEVVEILSQTQPDVVHHVEQLKEASESVDQAKEVENQMELSEKDEKAFAEANVPEGNVENDEEAIEKSKNTDPEDLVREQQPKQQREANEETQHATENETLSNEKKSQFEIDNSDQVNNDAQSSSQTKESEVSKQQTENSSQVKQVESPTNNDVGNAENAGNNVETGIIIKGAMFADDTPTEKDVRTQTVIVAQDIDPDRDDQVGVQLSKYNLNYVFADEDSRDYKFSNIYTYIDPKYLPKSVDLRPQWGNILDQLDLGSCVSNSVAYCVRFCYSKQLQGVFNPSRLFIYYNGREIAGYPNDEDSGMTIRDGYKSVAQRSVCAEENWEYNPNKFAVRPPESCYDEAKQHSSIRYINIDNDALQIKKSLKDGFPVSFGAALFQSFMSAETASSGIIPTPDISKERRCGGHAMTIVGYDDDKNAFLVANNWGDKWGIGGFCWFPYDYMLNTALCSDFWSLRYWA